MGQGRLFEAVQLLDPEKIQVIREGADVRPELSQSAEAVAEIKSKYQLPDSYVLYPAMTWPHKNHVGLLEATALIRQVHGVAVPLVFTGTERAEFWPQIQQRNPGLGIGVPSQESGVCAGD